MSIFATVKGSSLNIEQSEEEKQNLLELKHGSHEALEFFFNKYYKYLVVSSFKIIHDDARAKDLVQDVFFSLWEKRESLVISNVKAYLRRAVYNKSIDVIRKLKRGAWTEELTEKHQPIESKNVVHDMEAAELQEKINKAIDSLPERCRIVFSLSRFENLSHKEIASELNISVKTIENQITKAIKIIRIAILANGIIIFVYLNFSFV